MVILLILLLALLLGGLGFVIHVLWWIALVVLVIGLIGFVVRMGEGGSGAAGTAGNRPADGRLRLAAAFAGQRRRASGNANHSTPNVPATNAVISAAANPPAT